MLRVFCLAYSMTFIGILGGNPCIIEESPPVRTILAGHLTIIPALPSAMQVRVYCTRREAGLPAHEALPSKELSVNCKRVGIQFNSSEALGPEASHSPSKNRRLSLGAPVHTLSLNSVIVPAVHANARDAPSVPSPTAAGEARTRAGSRSGAESSSC